MVTGTVLSLAATAQPLLAIPVGVSAGAFDFIGITERYESDLAVFARRFLPGAATAERARVNSGAATPAIRWTRNCAPASNGTTRTTCGFTAGHWVAGLIARPDSGGAPRDPAARM